MYKPNYKITEKLLQDIIVLEIARKEIRQTALPRSAKKKLVQQMRLENLYHVSRFLGSELSREEVRSIFSGKQLDPRNVPAKLLINYRNAVEFIQAAVNDSYIELDPSILLHINKILLTGWTETWDAGRFREHSDKLDTKGDPWFRSDLVIDSEVDFRTYTGELLSWIKDVNTPTNAMIKVALTIYELYRAAPFVSGNAISLLAICELIFAHTRYLLGGLFPVTKAFSENKSDFYEALTESVKKQDPTLWVEKYIAGVSKEMSSLRDEVYRLQDSKIAKRKKKLLGLNERQLKILRYLKKEKKVARLKYMRLYEVSTMTAYRDLKELVDKKLVTERGKGRGSYYELIKPLEEEYEENILDKEKEFEQELKEGIPKKVFGSAEEINLDPTESIGDDPFEEYT